MTRELMQAQGPERLLAFLRSKDTVCQRYAALGLGNLALSPRTHTALLQRPAMAALSAMAESKDVETRRCVAFAFNNLCTNEENHTVAERLGLPVRLFDAAALERETPRLANPSDVVFQEVGCHGVAEAAALAMAGETASLIVPKRKSANATVAIARTDDFIDPATAGRALGHLHVIGIGPGMSDWRTPEAGRLIAAADEVVGYDLYLDLVAGLVPAAKRTTFPLGQETERCAYALEQAAGFTAKPDRWW